MIETCLLCRRFSKSAFTLKEKCSSYRRTRFLDTLFMVDSFTPKSRRLMRSECVDIGMAVLQDVGRIGE